MNSSSQTKGLIGWGWCAALLVALLAAMLTVYATPQSAWADDEASEIPRGALTLCDDPFSLDDRSQSEQETPVVDATEVPEAACLEPECGQDAMLTLNDPTDATGFSTEGPSIVCDTLGVENSTDAADSTRVSVSDDEPLVTSGGLTDDDASILEDNSKEASPENTDASMISTADSLDSIVVVDDEGLGRHEQATVLAVVTAGTPRSTLDSLVESVGGLDASGVTDEDLEYGLVKLKISDGSTVTESVNRIKSVAGFIDVQPNYVYKILEEDFYTDVDDEYAVRQWGLFRSNAFAAWDLGRTNGAVSVAVIDTGADLDHPDLADNIIATYNSVSSTNTIEDQVGHGTHVAGIIAGVANNGIGITGSSYNANLVIIKAAPYKSSDFDTASIARAYDWLASRDSSGMTVAEHYNVRVVNMSIGGLDETRAANLPDDILNRAMTRARDEQGLLTVVAAGNGHWLKLPYFAFPGDSDACLSVMNLCESHNDDGEAVGVELDDSSNYNMPGSNYKDICAPGSRIISTWINGKYAIDSGTSMAAPLVSGIAALLFAVNPTLTPQACISVLEASATDLGDEGWDEMYGFGEVNAAAAVNMVNAARIEGWKAVGIGDTIPFIASLGWGMQEDGNGWAWDVWQGDGGASVDTESGVLFAWAEGDVTVVASCAAKSGARISATKIVYVVDARIIGDETLANGESSSAYTTDDDRWTWVWKVENDTGAAHIDQDAILVADKPGTVYVTATCSSNTDIVLYHRVTIEA